MPEQTSACSADETNPEAPNSGEGSIQVRSVAEQIVEIVSDSGEGAQTAGLLFGTVCAKMGNGLWTVEIIPAQFVRYAM